MMDTAIRHERRRTTRKATHFTHFADDGYHFINQVAELLKTDRHKAARITRIILHAIRDSLPPPAAIEFAQGLPMALKALFVDRYDLSGKPVLLRSKYAFCDYVFCLDEKNAGEDFSDYYKIEEALVAFYAVLYRMDEGQTNKLYRRLGGPVQKIIRRRFPFTDSVT